MKVMANAGVKIKVQIISKLKELTHSNVFSGHIT